MKTDDLAALFRKLGARDPEAWARSQVEEGTPQLARFLFLRQAWREVVTEDDAAWIDGAIERARASPNEPYAGVGHALEKLRDRGATNEELADVVRGMQAQLLFNLCYLLEDPGDVEPEVEEVVWSLVQVERRATWLTPSEDFMSRCLQQIRAAARCGLAETKPGNPGLQPTPRSRRG